MPRRNKRTKAIRPSFVRGWPCPSIVNDDDLLLRNVTTLEVSELPCADWYTWSRGWTEWRDVRFRWRIVLMEVMLQGRGLSRSIRVRVATLWRKVLWSRAPHRFLKQANGDDGPLKEMGRDLLGAPAIVNSSLRNSWSREVKSANYCWCAWNF